MYILILSPPFLSEPDHITSNERSGAVPNVCVKILIHQYLMHLQVIQMEQQVEGQD